MRLIYTNKKDVLTFNNKAHLLASFKETFINIKKDCLEALTNGTATKEDEDLFIIVNNLLEYGFEFITIEDLDKLMAKAGYKRLPYSYPYASKKHRTIK